MSAYVLFTARPCSHRTLQSWHDGAEVPSQEVKVKQGARSVPYRCRWLNEVPIRDSRGAAIVTWLDLEIIDAAGRAAGRNSVVNERPVNTDTVAELGACGRARWKIKNETFSTLKTRGYALEHTPSHGREHLALVLATRNPIAFAMHTVADLADPSWRETRKAIGTRWRLFEDLRALITCLVFPSSTLLVQRLILGKLPPAVFDGRRHPPSTLSTAGSSTPKVQPVKTTTAGSNIRRSTAWPEAA